MKYKLSLQLLIVLIAVSCNNKEAFNGKKVTNIIIDKYTCEEQNIEPRHFTITFPNDYGKQDSDKNYLDFDNDKDEVLQIGSLTLDLTEIKLGVLDKEVAFNLDEDKVPEFVYNETIDFQNQIIEPFIDEALFQFYNSGAKVSLYSKLEPRSIELNGVDVAYNEIVFKVKHANDIVYQQFSIICIPNMNNLKQSLMAFVQLRLKDKEHGIDKLKKSTAFEIIESISFLD